MLRKESSSLRLAFGRDSSGLELNFEEGIDVARPCEGKSLPGKGTVPVP